jgi:ABC-2 type transport system ATP-binding protein
VQSVISARGVVKRYGTTTALAGATVDVGHGVTGLLGANGAGKTTLIGMVLGLHRPDEGSLRVLGLDPTEAGPEVRERVGYAPEHHNLPADMSAYDLVRHLAEIHGLPRKEAINRASDVLWQVGLGEERLRPVGTMSTGQRQRVKLAAAIAHDPMLVLLDEPTDGLDPNQRDAMLALIRRVGREFGIDIVLSSHLLEEVERICDQAVIIAGGEVAVSGTLDELRGAGSGAIVELDDGVEAVAALLTGRGLDVVGQGRRLEVTSKTLGEEILFDELRDALAVTGAGLRRLLPRRASLEDVYLRVGSAPLATAEPLLEGAPR